MQRIALFVDVDNTALELEEFTSLIECVAEEGNIAYGKLYGVVDRKNREIIDYAVEKGYDIAPPMRIKKRGSRIYDSRITVDVMDTVCNNSSIDIVAIIAAPADMIPLFAKLHEYGIGIMAQNTLDEQSMFFVDYEIKMEEPQEKIEEHPLPQKLIDDIGLIAGDIQPLEEDNAHEASNVAEEDAEIPEADEEPAKTDIKVIEPEAVNETKQAEVTAQPEEPEVVDEIEKAEEPEDTVQPEEPEVIADVPEAIEEPEKINSKVEEPEAVADLDSFDILANVEKELLSLAHKDKKD
ncbi:MAG: NYN domain-containing protein [Clostridia bacterium]|nr:NYN domain-containing protein [Clostridia bacterium]